jgi:fatty acid kinase fatty acid binding subunit
VDLNATNTAIVLDSTADFPEAPHRFPSWRVVPLYVRFGAESYRDYVDIGPAEFYERLRTADELPTTSQPTPQDFQSGYEELDGFERILAFTVSAKLSGTYESAVRAAEESGGRVRVIDTETASAAITMLALGVQRRLERATTDDEVDDFIARFKRESGLVFTLDTLEFLARGGRIGRAASWAGQLLNIKPILTLEDGEVLPLKRVRGNRKAIHEFAEAFRAGTTDEPGLRVGIAHAEAPERMAALEELVRDLRPNAEIEVATTLGPVVGTHAGPGTVGLFWFQDGPPGGLTSA